MDRSNKRRRPERLDSIQHDTECNNILQRLAWLDSRLNNVSSTIPISVDGLAASVESHGLSAAIHARRMRRKINANLLAEADPIPVSQIKIVRGCVTVVKDYQSKPAMIPSTASLRSSGAEQQIPPSTRVLRAITEKLANGMSAPTFIVLPECQVSDHMIA